MNVYKADFHMYLSDLQQRFTTLMFECKVLTVKSRGLTCAATVYHFVPFLQV